MIRAKKMNENNQNIDQNKIDDDTSATELATDEKK